MFNCINHGWSHLQNPCPLCHPVTTSTSSSSSIWTKEVAEMDPNAHLQTLLEHAERQIRNDREDALIAENKELKKQLIKQGESITIEMTIAMNATELELSMERDKLEKENQELREKLAIATDLIERYAGPPGAGCVLGSMQHLFQLTLKKLKPKSGV